MEKFVEFVEIVAKLRRECPWDKQQTFETLKPYLIEEVHEAIEAIDEKDYDHLCEELGDMLLHVVMVAELAREQGHFNIEDVIKGISEKMVRRHPHVFGSKKLKNSKQVLNQWQKIKRQEKKASSRR